MSDEPWVGHRVVNANTGTLDYRIRDQRVVDPKSGQTICRIRG